MKHARSILLCALLIASVLGTAIQTIGAELGTSCASVGCKGGPDYCAIITISTNIVRGGGILSVTCFTRAPVIR